MQISGQVISRNKQALKIRTQYGVAVFSRLQESILAGVLLMVLLILFFGKSLFQGQVLSGADAIYSTPFFSAVKPAGFSQSSNALLFDQVYQFTPWRYYAWNSIRNGHLPLWNPYSSAGTPFVATMQSAVFYPINLLMAFVPFKFTAVLSAILRLWIAGMSTYLLTRRYGLLWFASIISAVSFMFSGFLIVWLGHPHTNAAIWLPAMILLAEMMITSTRPGRLAFLTGLAALVAGTEYTGGHIETSVDILFAMALYYLVRWIMVIRPQAKPWSYKLNYLFALPVLSAGLGAALAAVQLAPFLEWLSTSTELQNRGGFMAGFQLIDTSFWKELLKIPLAIFPNLYNNPTWNEYPYWSFLPWGNYNENILYIGTLSLLFAVIAVLTRWKEEPQVRAWTIVGLICLGRAFHLPMFDLINHLPILSLGQPDRLRLVLAFGLCILAGFGAQTLWDARLPVQKTAETLWVRGNLAVILGGLVILLASNLLLPAIQGKIVAFGRSRVDAELASRSTPPQHPMEHYYAEVDRMVDGLLAAFRFDNLDMYLPILWAGAGLICLHWYRRRASIKPVPFKFSLLALVIVDVMSFGYGYNPSLPTGEFYPQTSIVRQIQSDSSLFRTTALRQDLIPDAHMMFGLQDVRGLDFPTVWYNQYINLIPDRIPWLTYGSIFGSVDSPLLHQLNIKYVIASNPDMLENNPELKLVGKYGNVFLGEKLNITPRAFMVYEAVGARSDDEAARILSGDPGAILRRVVLSDVGDMPLSTTNGGAVPSSRVDLVQYLDESSTWRVSTGREGYLFLSDAYYPGWNVYLDEQPATLYRANLAFRAVSVPQGEHVISFRYEPASIRLGGFISILALVVVIFMLILTFKSAFNLKEEVSG